MDQQNEKNTDIARYALFGEHQTSDDPEFVHIEKIKTRSRLYDWRISPHTHQRMFQMVYIKEGEAEVWLDQGVKTVSGPCAVCVPGGVVHSFNFRPGTDGWVLTVSELLLIDARYRRSRKLFEPLFVEPLTLSFDNDPDSNTLIGGALGRLYSEFRWQRLGRSSMFEWLIRTILMTIRRQLDSQAVEPEQVGDRHQLYARFRKLLEDHYRDQWQVADYADALALSQARLNRLCHSFTSKGAGELIQHRLALEAQRLLIYSSAKSSMIAYDLGFRDPSYFSRFFKRRIGMTPRQFREEKMADPFPVPNSNTH